MSNYTDGYLQACHDIKVYANNAEFVRSVLGVSISRAVLNNYIDHFARMETRNRKSSKRVDNEV